MSVTNKIEENMELTSLPTTVLLLGASLGLLADRLLWVGGSTGLGFVVWVALFCFAASYLVARTSANLLREVLGWSGIALVAAFMLLFRTTPIAILAMWLTMLIAAAMIFLHKSGRTLQDSTVTDHLISLCRVPLHATVSIIPVLSRIEIRSAASSPRLRAATRGALLASPILLVFVLLFSSADAVFSRYAEQLLDIFSPTAFRHLLMIAAFGWLATGLLNGVCENRFFISRKERSLLKLETDDTAAFMGLIVALFLVFVFLQLGYLFGGPETIEATSGLTLAEYARRGFFELLGVAGLTLVLLITLANSNCDQRVFRPLALILVVCVLIILTSAGQRLGMYITEFGLTIDRITAAAVMLWLGLTMILFVLTILRGQTKYFAAGLTVTGLIVAFFLVLANPAALVARVNIDRAISDNRPVDIYYLLSLGTDAAPVIIDKIEDLSGGARCMAISETLLRWYPKGDEGINQDNGWRGWNASRITTHNMMLEKGPELLAAAKNCTISKFIIRIN